jgi:thioester reductase-like protein
MLVYFCAVLVEKILRVQPAVRRIYLLVRAADEPSAQQRVQQVGLVMDHDPNASSQKIKALK